MKITVKTLVDLGACDSHVRLFQTTFGDSAEVTEDNFLIAVKAGLDMRWGARNLLTRDNFLRYKEESVRIYKKYSIDNEPAWRKYLKGKGDLCNKYDEHRAPFGKKHKEERDSLFEDYMEDIGPSLREYEESLAKVLYRLFKSSEDATNGRKRT